MRWPTLIEQGIGVLILLCFAFACLVALGIGLGDRVWAESALRFLLNAFDIYKNTIKASEAKNKRLEKTLKQRDAEIDKVIFERDSYKRQLDDKDTELEAAQKSVKESRQQVIDQRKDYEEQLAIVIEDRNMHGKRANALEKELHHFKHPGQALVEAACMLLFVAILTMTVLGFIGVFPSQVFADLVARWP